MIDLIMENSPWRCSQRVQGLWHLHEKYSCCAGFCHKTPVDKARLWQTAKREGRRESEGFFERWKARDGGRLVIKTRQNYAAFTSCQIYGGCY